MSPRTALSIGALAVAALHSNAHATADWLAAAPTCTAGSLQTLQSGVASPAGGFILSGRNPPLTYFCAVSNPDDAATVPSWKLLKLQYLDPNPAGGGVVAQLYAKSRTSGVATLVASVASQQTSVVKVLAVPLPAALSFGRNTYYITLQLDAPELPVEAHAVMLTTR